MIWLILAILAAIVIITYKIVTRRSLFEKRVDTVLKTDRYTLTPKQVAVYRENGRVPTAEQLAAIDTGLQFTIDKAHNLGYRRALDTHNYTVVMLESEANKNIAVFRVPVGRNSKYKGTAFDHDGYLLVTGMVRDTDELVVAVAEPLSQQPDQLEDLARVTGYEAEHCIAYWNDGPLYERTKHHGGSEGHPIF